MKNVVQEIASQLTPPAQHEIIYTTQPPESIPQPTNQSQQYLYEEQYIQAPNETEYYVEQSPMINANSINDAQPCNDSFKNERNRSLLFTRNGIY